jgi:hypothetical protein
VYAIVLWILGWKADSHRRGGKPHFSSIAEGFVEVASFMVVLLKMKAIDNDLTSNSSGDENAVPKERKEVEMEAILPSDKEDTSTISSDSGQNKIRGVIVNKYHSSKKTGEDENSSDSTLTADNLAKLESSLKLSSSEQLISSAVMNQAQQSPFGSGDVASMAHQKSEDRKSYESMEEKLLEPDVDKSDSLEADVGKVDRPRARSASSPPSMIAPLPLPSNSSLSPLSTVSTRKSISLRRGKWTVEEEAYVARVIQDFNSGYLDAPAGTTLRTYLSEKLQCDPMRITKKFTGDACIGKRVFHPAVRSLSNSLSIDKAQVCHCLHSLYGFIYRSNCLFLSRRSWKYWREGGEFDWNYNSVNQLKRQPQQLQLQRDIELLIFQRFL